MDYALTGRWQSEASASFDGREREAAIERELADALALLSEREREALLLVAWEGLGPDRAARAARRSATAFRLRVLYEIGDCWKLSGDA